MNRKQAMRRRALAGALSMAIVSAGVVMVIDAANPDPAIHVEGLELKMKTDPGTGKQSVQALVEVYVTNVLPESKTTVPGTKITTGFFQGVSMTLDYNRDYLTPSDWVTNESYDEGVKGDGSTYGDGWVDPIDYDDPLHHLFFHTDPGLYDEKYAGSTKPVDPLKFWINDNTSVPTASNRPVADGAALDANAGEAQIKFDLVIRNEKDPLLKEGSGLVKKTAATGSNTNYYYFKNEDADDNKILLGTLSFRVNDKIVENGDSIEDLERKLKEMTEKFNGLDWTYDKDQTNDPSIDASGESVDFLFRETRNKEGNRQVHHLRETETSRGPVKQKSYTIEKGGYAIGIQINLDADDVIRDAWAVKDDITINSYQAYTNGDVGDLAIALQNYAESVRVSRVSGKQQDLSIYWGDPVDSPKSDSMPDDGPGMIIYKAKQGMVDDGKGNQVPGWVKDTSAPRYRFKWTAAGFTVEEDSGSGFTAVASSAVYGQGKLFDPRGDYLNNGQYGNYIMEQYFTYWEATGSGGSGAMALKTFPKPIQVTLHVTPINIIDASVEKERLTYRNDIDEVPQTFAELDLADKAKLTMDVTLNGVTPTMPVSWKPANSPSWTAGNLNSDVIGVPGTGNPNLSKPAPDNVAKWPIGATAVDDKTGVGDYTFVTKVLETDMRAKYPWATTHGDFDPINSYRRIVDVSPNKPDEPNAQLPRYVMWAEPYEVAPTGASAGVSAGDPVARLRVTIARQEATWNAASEEWDWNFVNMDPAGATDYQFKLYMPNDQQIRADAGESWFGTQSGQSWSGVANSFYTTQRRVGVSDPVKGFNNLNIYEFTISPGDLNAGDTYAAQRETLRQYINLGGWFSADVLEPNTTVWNDRISGFSKPRTNIHTMSYTLDPAASSVPVPTGTETWLFDYTGNRAGLMPFKKDSDLPTYLTLPADESVEVRYDALTGSQPGQMRQFKVEVSPSPAPDRWSNVLGSKANILSPTPDAPPWVAPQPSATPSPIPGEVVTYGEDLFAREYDYSSFGTVNNPNTAVAAGYPSELQDRKVKVKTEVQELPPSTPNTPKWELKLTYEQTGDNVTEYDDGVIKEVKRVTFDNKMVGFTYQQIVTLTVINTGNMEIRGLHIDIPDTPNGPCFRLVTPPPSVLAVGASATFQLSYIQNLSEGTYEDIFTTEPIHIWHDNSGPASDGKRPVTLPGHTDEGFEAVLKVTKTRPYKVTVVIHPGTDETGKMDKPMGDGWLVEGVTTTSGADKYDGTPGANVYEQNDRFWVLTQPKDEYALITTNDNGTPRVWVYYVRDDDATQTKVYLGEYLAGGGNSGFGTVDKSFVTQDNPERLFWAEMPDSSVTVHVHYYEPLLSKLRLSDLHAYAWDQWSEVKLKTPAEPAAWEEKAGISSDPADANSYLNDPNAFERPLNIHKGGNDYEQTLFLPEKDEYIVFLDPSSAKTDNLCGVSIALRKLVTHINGVGDTENPAEQNNVDIYPNVMMTLDDADGTIVCNDVPDPTVVPPAVPSTPSTVGPTYHHSSPFSAPVDDPTQTSIAQTTVTITISYDGTALIPPEGYESRTYKVRFVRRMEVGKAKHIALAGNSPYGMIENDATITDKAAAKAVFDAANRFDFSDTVHTPKQAVGLLTNIYWPEAWGTGVNYDKDVTALFVYAGQEFYDPGVKNIYNNAGDYIDGIMVSRSLEYVKLNTTMTTPWDRFNVDPAVSTNIATVDLGAVPAADGVIPGDTVTLTTDETSTSYNGLINGLVGIEDIRPGIYQLKYTYKDHDKTTDLYFTRPLIVLSPNGDVDANWVQQGAGPDRVEGADKTAIQRRFGSGTALPYELPTSVYTAADGLVYKYRIVDANNDRNINNIDAGLIRKVTTLINTPRLTEFYRPTEYTYPVKP